MPNVKEFSQYVDRTQRTTHNTKYDIATRALSKEVATYYGLSDEEYNTFINTLKDDQEVSDTTRVSVVLP